MMTRWIGTLKEGGVQRHSDGGNHGHIQAPTTRTNTDSISGMLTLAILTKSWVGEAGIKILRSLVAELKSKDQQA